MLFRRVAFFLVPAIALLVVCWPAGLDAAIGAPAPVAPAALLQAAGAQVHTPSLIVPAMSGPLYPALQVAAEGSSPVVAEGGPQVAAGSGSQTAAGGDPPGKGRGEAEWAPEPGWGAALLNAARRTSLRPAPPVGQLLQQGEYARRTAPSASGPVAVPAWPQARAGALLLATAMIVTIMAVAPRAPRAAEVREPAAAGARAQIAPLPIGPCLRCQKPSEGLHRFPVRPGILSLAMRDQVADWERVRLVPT